MRAYTLTDRLNSYLFSRLHIATSSLMGKVDFRWGDWVSPADEAEKITRSVGTDPFRKNLQFRAHEIMDEYYLDVGEVEAYPEEGMDAHPENPGKSNRTGISFLSRIVEGWAWFTQYW